MVRRGDIPALLDDPFVARAVRDWSRYRRFGLAHGAGYANERAQYIRIIEICEGEYEHSARMMRERDNGGK